jgi:hypothetical protein
VVCGVKGQNQCEILAIGDKNVNIITSDLVAPVVHHIANGFNTSIAIAIGHYCDWCYLNGENGTSKWQCDGDNGGLLVIMAIHWQSIGYHGTNGDPLVTMAMDIGDHDLGDHYMAIH